MHFDEKKNRVIIKVGGKEIELPPQDIREILPYKDKAQRVKDLRMIIHDIEREELTQIETFIARMVALDKAMDKIEVDIKGCGKLKDVKKHEGRLKALVARKNACAEIRRAVALLEKKKKGLRVRIAKLETSGEED